MKSFGSKVYSEQFISSLWQLASDEVNEFIFGFFECDGQEPEIRMNGVDGEWILALGWRMMMLGGPGVASLDLTLITISEPFTQLLPQTLVTIQSHHQQVFIAVQHVLPVPVQSEISIRWCQPIRDQY